MKIFLCFVTIFVTFAMARRYPGIYFECEGGEAPMNEVCNNMCWAGNHGSPGLLTRDINDRANRRRYRLSGCKRGPCKHNKTPFAKFGDSCDEYPFKSTLEGGTGAILRCVPLAENTEQGRQLKMLYAEKNVGNRDKFVPGVTKYKNAKYCVHAHDKKDTGEFTLKGTGRKAKFVHAKPKRAADAEVFEDNLDGNYFDSSLRAVPTRFETDNGDQPLLFLPAFIASNVSSYIGASALNAATGQWSVITKVL